MVANRPGYLGVAEDDNILNIRIAKMRFHSIIAIAKAACLCNTNTAMEKNNICGCVFFQW